MGALGGYVCGCLGISRWNNKKGTPRNRFMLLASMHAHVELRRIWMYEDEAQDMFAQVVLVITNQSHISTLELDCEYVFAEFCTDQTMIKENETSTFIHYIHPLGRMFEMLNILYLLASFSTRT